MPIDIIIPLGNGSYWHNNELMYCLRGIERYLRNYRNVIIIGKKPEWLTRDIISYDHPDKFNHERNIYEKIKFACGLRDVSDRFLFMNDDHFLTAPVDAENYPYYWRHTLDEKIASRTRPDGYRISLVNTRDILPVDTRKYFDIHCPIIYDKAMFLRTMADVNWEKPMGYVIKSLYCNKVGVPAVEMRDLKMKGGTTYDWMKKSIDGRHVFSISDSVICPDFERFMRELYPNRSKWEINNK